MTFAPARRRLGSAAALAAGVWAAPPALAQTLTQGAAVDFPWWRWFAALGFCLALAVVGAYALRARVHGRGGAWTLPRSLAGLLGGGATATRRLTVIEALRVSPTLEVCLISCDAQEYLLAATPHGAVQLAPAPVSGREVA